MEKTKTSKKTKIWSTRESKFWFSLQLVVLVLMRNTDVLVLLFKKISPLPVLF